MRALTTTNLDYLTARLHGRRSRMAQADRLDALCRLRSVSELARQVWPDGDVQVAAELQRRLVEELAREMSEFLPLLDRRGARLIEWMLARSQLHVPMPPVSWEEFAASLPAGPLRASVQEASTYSARPFYMEAALDRGYYRELVARAAALRSADKAVVEPLVCHQVETFQRQLLARGQFNYGLTPDDLAEFTGTVTVQVSELPAEAAAGNRLYLLANRAMRRSPIELGAVVGYVMLRQIEIANLTTISEGLRLGLSAEMIRARLTPRSMDHV